VKALVIVDGSTGDARRATHAIDLALELARADDVSIRVFLLGAMVELAQVDGRGHPTAQGAALGRLVVAGVEIAVSEAEMAARGLRSEDLILGAQPASGSSLAAWTLEADRVLVF
jgi:uncharacterized protein involved in oxidation of intracellular sulfur